MQHNKYNGFKLKRTDINYINKTEYDHIGKKKYF